MKNLIKTIQNAAFQQELWQRGSRIVLGVSGGADSVCMLDVLAKIAPKAGLKLLIAHVNYGLRGKDSDKDEEFVRELAKKYGLKIEVLNLTSSHQPHPALRATFSSNKEKGILKNRSENDLRNIRYDFFERVRKENKFDLVAVAHNADDQVETFLMRIIRGAGLQGLAAMKYKSGPPRRMIRPLLGISRKEILNYLNRTNGTYRTDRTNERNLFFRNKVRNKLLPYLEKNFNPQIRKTIFGATTSIAEDLDLLEEIVEKTCQLDKIEFLSVKKILNLHPALQRRVLLKFIGEKKADLKNIESGHIAEIMKILQSTKGKAQVVVFQGLKLTRKGDKIVISRSA